jgi:hypothetical protein
MTKRMLGTAWVLALLVSAAPAVAQEHRHAQKKAEAGHDMGGMMEMKSGWQALDAFHALMHQAHHALVKSGDAAPARELAGQMAAAAETLSNDAIPAACQAEGQAGRTKWLAASAKAFAALVADGASDATVRAAVNGLHDLMEPIAKGCRHKEH